MSAAKTITAADAYPLKWPRGTPRATTRHNSAFKKRSWIAGAAEVRAELARMGASDVVISSNLRLKPDGKPYAEQLKMMDVGVAVYFQLKGVWTCLPCDKWNTMADNFHAIALTIERMRDLDRYGVGKSGQSFDGFKALPAAASATTEDPFAVLGIARLSSEAQIRAAHREQCRLVSLEGGDTTSALQRLNVARDEALQAIA